MRILILNESLTHGGAQSMSVELANALAEKDECEVYIAAAEGALQKRLSKNIVFIKLPLVSLINTFFVFSVLIKNVSEIRPHIIHSHGGTILGFVSLARSITNISAPIIFTHHSQRFTRLPKFLSVFILNHFCNHLIAISKGKRCYYLQQDIKKNKISTIPNFIDHSAFQQNSNFDSIAYKQTLGISEKSAIITITGRIVPGKNHVGFIDILIECAQKSEQKLTGLIVGDGPLLVDLKKKIKDCPPELDIVFTGYRNDIVNILSITDVFLFPSEYEILPMVLIEASAAGVPIVCSDIPGNRDVVQDGHTGYLIKGSNKNYCDALIKLLFDNKMAIQMSRNGKMIVKKYFDKEVVVQSIFNLYLDQMEQLS